MEVAPAYHQRTLRNAFEDQPTAEAEACGYLLFGRVNTLLVSVDDAIAALRAAGFKERRPPLGVAGKEGTPLATPFAAPSGSDDVGATDARRTFCRDALFPEVLAFPPGAALRGLDLVADGRLLLQDRASCACAHALAPRRGAHVIDACAAPGKKAEHLAALMANVGRVSAFDRDAARAASRGERSMLAIGNERCFFAAIRCRA